MSGFSPGWEEAYADSSTSAPMWPFSDLVRLVRRYAPWIGADSRVLELGFGAGANFPFIEQTGAEYWGIEGSQAAVDEARTRFPDVAQRFICGDFTQGIPLSNIDIVIDRSSLTHNQSSDIVRTLRECASSLSSRGQFVGVDWFSDQHDDAKRGLSVDHWTRQDIPDGQFENLGKVHFSSAEHLEELFKSAGLKIIHLELKVREVLVPSHNRHAAYDLVAVPVR